MFFELILTVITVGCAAVLVNMIGIADNKYKNFVSLKESLDLCNLPVITFENNGNKFNFMLDTGATESHISQTAVENMTGESSDRQICIQGFAGDAETSGGKIVDLIYKDRVFTTELFISPALDDTFKEIKQNLGVQLHGIIGNNFLREHGYVLDFYDLIAYSKK